MQYRFELTVSPDTTRAEMMSAMIAAGFRTLAAKHHPDIGGNTKIMQAINDAHDHLKVVARLGA
jgi:DnaJ-class molecular chaperone